ncbi:MAG TPA: dTDP-glucose 4,6-dehydratase, partial [Ferruginibacter sp.]|nr:dTDP-glucose 4,6-dehydratase [Ferruginibacter sp.]
MHTILLTGGAGFIGSHLTRLFVRKYPQYRIVNLDKLTYAGNLENLKDIEKQPNYHFVKGDITDLGLLRKLFDEYKFTAVLHCAAESHVDRSITDPMAFIHTNVLGTAALLQTAKEFWAENMENKIFYHISTDEVYGSLGKKGYFTENSAYDPRSPYAASKASSDHIVRAFYHTYKLPVKISNCSNNYGPFHFPEKLIPLCIYNTINNKPLPIYGKGENVRDWLFVEDHVNAIDLIFHRGKPGETYNIGGHNEWTNLKLVKELCRQMDEKLKRERGTSEKLITYVKDRA